MVIAQGKETYMSALEDSDSLAEVEPYGDCEFELLTYAGDYAYEELTGRSAYDDCTYEMDKQMLAKVSKEIKYHPMIEYPLEIPDAVFVYPKLGAAFAQIYSVESFQRDSIWNTSLPEVKKLVEKGAEEVRKLRRAGQKRNDKVRKCNGQSR